MSSDRLTGLDASFLHLEDASSHMHVAGVMIFEGSPPPYEELLTAIEARLGLVPRYRQRLAFVPFGQGRPKWVDDPHLNLRYHVRSTALPSPGTEEQLQDLAGRVFSQQLDRDKPLWEVWLVEGLEGERFALLAKTHHALVDGVSGMDIVSVLFDTSPEPAAPPDPGDRWLPRPLPSRAQLLAEAIVERATIPAELTGSVRAVLRGPGRLLAGVRDAALGVGAMAWTGLNPAPSTPYNARIGPHRRFTWVRADLPDVKAIKNELGGTVNDVVLATVAGALGALLRRVDQLRSGRRLRPALGPRRPGPRRPRFARGARRRGWRRADARSGSGGRVRDKLAHPARDLGIALRVQRLESSTRTVKDAGAAVGADESEIAKAIVFVAH